ncbi:MAG: YncE family protein [Saprospiraceae bacterium]
MNKANLIILIHLGIFALFSVMSCGANDNDDEADTINTFQNGLFIVNQGISNGTDGTISFYDKDREEVANDIFASKNELPLNGILSSMTTVGNRAYIVGNSSGSLTLVESESMEKVTEVSGFDLPRFMLPLNNSKAYVSQWGSNGSSGSIQVFNLDNNTITGEINTPGGAERMLKRGNHVYVTHTGGFFLDSVITKIDITTDQIVYTIPVGISPQSLQLDAEGALWVLAKGLETFSDSKPGTLAKIVNDEVVLSITVPLGSRDLVIDNSKTTLYYINGLNQKVYTHKIDQNALSLAPFSDTPVTALSFDPQNNLVIGMDSKNFQVEGQLLFFNQMGDLTSEFEVGVVPGFITY